jgi:parallel beta-helix repeat protein
MKKNICFVLFIALSSLFVSCDSAITTPDTDQSTTKLAKKPDLNTWVLYDDMVVDATVVIPDGMTLDGNGHTITAIDPDGGHFVGAVVMNGGTTAHVKNLTVNAEGLANVCDGGANRLRGIMFEGASGTIMHCTVIGINQGPSGCQEGNGIEVRNTPFDGTHPNTQNVEIAHCSVLDYQKTGIVCNGDVDVNVHHNVVGESATQLNLAANSIQLGFGAIGVVTQNQVNGNQWMGLSNYAASAILVYAADNVEVSKNIIGGNSDVGIFFLSDNGIVDNNKVSDVGADHPSSGYDIGLGNYGVDNLITNNKVKGFTIPYEGVTDGKNKIIPGPQNFN